MTNPDPEKAESKPGETPYSDASSEHGAPPSSPVLSNIFLCVVVAAAACLFYALKIESSLFRALSLQLFLCGVAVRAAKDAAKIRHSTSEAKGDEGLAQKREAAAIHYLFLAAPLVAISVLAGLSMVAQMAEVAVPRSQQQVVGGAILSVLAASLWTVLARMLQQPLEATERSVTKTEERAVIAALSESRLSALLSGVALMAATVHPPVEGWLAWGLSVWVMTVSFEHLFRVFVAWFKTVTLASDFHTPIQSLLREVFLSSANPVAKAFDIAEARFGLSLRSSWTIGFFRRSVLPIAVGCLMVVWLSTCFVVIQPHQAGLEERFGVVQKERLSPGLQTKLPWPFGTIRRFPAGVVQTMKIGFEEEGTEPNIAEDKDRTLLWTKPHAQEFSLVLGSESELVAINAIVYFKIAEDTQGFLDHALASSNPEVALEAFAYRVLMEQTRSATLADLLSRGRDQFAATVRDRLREYSIAERLGLEVVDVSLINLHPPVEVANSYLDVINAEVDSKQVVIVAQGESAKQILEAEQGSNGRVASARVAAAKRVATAGQESSEFIAVGEAFTAAPETYRLRLWFEAFERVLAGRRLFIVDSELPDVIFDERAESVDPAFFDSAPTNKP